MDASCLSSTLSNSGFVLGTCTGGLVEIMYRSFRILPTLCFTFWHRCFPGGILAGYQGLIFCASGLLLPRPPERLEGPFLTSALTRPWGITLSLHLFLRLLGSAGQPLSYCMNLLERWYSSFSQISGLIESLGMMETRCGPEKTCSPGEDWG